MIGFVGLKFLLLVHLGGLGDAQYIPFCLPISEQRNKNYFGQSPFASQFLNKETRIVLDRVGCR